MTGNEIIFATANFNKASEIQQLLGSSVRLLTLKDVDILDNIPETGKTLKENAALKAQYVFERKGLPCFADDTGLEVYALHGEPGVYSARYAGEFATDENNIQLLLKNLNDITTRSARFVTYICYIDATGAEHFFSGELAGEITAELAGEGGFGYDPVFRPNGSGLTLAQMTLDEKNRISHRAIAFRQLVKYLNNKD